MLVQHVARSTENTVTRYTINKYTIYAMYDLYYSVYEHI
jgi:hypothetical protein